MLAQPQDGMIVALQIATAPGTWATLEVLRRRHRGRLRAAEARLRAKFERFKEQDSKHDEP